MYARARNENDPSQTVTGHIGRLTLPNGAMTLVPSNTL
jgi:hypothetical protein